MLKRVATRRRPRLRRAIYVFPGTKEECRKPGVQTMGSNCCKDEDEASNACGFENLAKELGWSDAAIAMITSLGGYFAKKRLANLGGAICDQSGRYRRSILFL